MIGQFRHSAAVKVLFIMMLTATTLVAKSVSLAWDPVEDELRTYRVHWGFRPGVYGNSVDAGKNPFFTLHNLQDGIRYYIAVTAVDLWGNESLFSNEVATADTVHQTEPDYFDLHNYPNPFNQQTTLAFTLPEKARITLSIYNALGQKVRTLKSAELEAGRHSVLWLGDDDYGRQVPSGAYLGVLAVDAFRICRPIMLLR